MILIALLASVYGVGLAVPLKGALVDWMLSRYISRQTCLRTHCKNAKIIHWSKVSFQSILLENNLRHPLLMSGKGSLDFGRSRLILINLENLRVLETANVSKFISSLPIAKSLEGGLLLDQFKAGVAEENGERLIKIFQCSTSDFSLRGGLVLYDHRVTKAHFYVSLASSRLKKLPSALRARLYRNKNGWAGAHFVYCGNRMILKGRYGLLLEAAWSS